MPPIGGTNQLKLLGQNLGLKQGGAPISPLGYAPGSASTPKPNDPGGIDLNGSLAAYNALLAKIKSLSAPTPFTYSTFDTNANSAKARAAAAGAVNPLYVDKLNTFVNNQKIAQQRLQENSDLQNNQLDTALKNVLEANKISGERATQDTQGNIDTLNTQDTQFQQDSGLNFDRARTALAGNVAASGLTGSGLGTQQTTDATTARNTAEGRQATDFQQKRDQVQLFKTRTFEDLARSGDLATSQTGEQKKGVQINLNRALDDIKTSLDEEKFNLEQQRLAALAAEQQNQEKLGFQGFLNTLTGQNRVNTAQAYAGLY